LANQSKHRLGRCLTVVQRAPCGDELTEVFNRQVSEAEPILIYHARKHTDERLTNVVVGSALSVDAFQERLPLVSSKLLLHGARG